MLAERCFHALDHDRIEFRDTTGRCAIASAGAAALGIGVCVLAAPELVVGTVIIAGVVVVGFVIKEALDAYELKWAEPEDARPAPETTPAPRETSPKQRPKPDPKGPDFPPVAPPDISERNRRPDCKPVPVKHRGGNKDHNNCADKIPNNSFPGRDVLVNGKNFDALQLTTRALWEVKTDNFDTYTPDLRDIVIRTQGPKLLVERGLAMACGFDFRIGVLSSTHKDELERAFPELEGLIVVMDWC